MWNSFKEKCKEQAYEQLNDSNYYGTCKSCGDTTSYSKLEEFNGECEDCFYEHR